MAEEITIDQAYLGHEKSEFGLTAKDLKLFDEKGDIRVDVFVDGELVKSEKKTKDSIVVKRPTGGAGKTSTVVVAANDGKLLNVVQYDGTVRRRSIDSVAEETALIKAIKASTAQIVAAINSQKGAGRTPPGGDAKEIDTGGGAKEKDKGS
jgi:hypothetical protein